MKVYLTIHQAITSQDLHPRLVGHIFFLRNNYLNNNFIYLLFKVSSGRASKAINLNSDAKQKESKGVRRSSAASNDVNIKTTHSV